MREPAPITGLSPLEVYLDQLRRYAISNHIIDSPDIRAHHSVHGVALSIEAQGGGGAGGSGTIVTAVAKSIPGDGVLLVRRFSELTSPTPSDRLIKVAMPHALRMAAWDGEDIFLGGPSDPGSTLEYIDENKRYIKREVSAGVFVRIAQRIWPPYSVEPSAVTAYPLPLTVLRITKPDGGTGVWIDAGNNVVAGDDPLAVEQLLWVDLNVDARAWHSEVNPYRVCQNNLPKLGLFTAGEVQDTT